MFSEAQRIALPKEMTAARRPSQEPLCLNVRSSYVTQHKGWLQAFFVTSHADAGVQAGLLARVQLGKTNQPRDRSPIVHCPFEVSPANQVSAGAQR